ncbi:MAG TPA: hypothetical protein VNX21_05720 [Candidatus Thermoplasmatota archaeon]|nr:hypothetical protein [Candidatus Thermoplasmatota archaeon]
MMLGVVLVVSLASVPTLAHGTCAHEAVHQYGVAGSTGASVHDPTTSEEVASPGVGFVIVNDSETGDCDGDGVVFDFDGDLDVGAGGGAFGHGPWATHCGFHQEAAGTVTVSDLIFGATVGFVTGSGDTNSWVPDPVTGENTCVTDGVISPGTDPEGDDCLSAGGAGTQPITCPGGGDGLLWVFIGHGTGGGSSESGCNIKPSGIGCSNPGVMGIITSP